MFNNVRFPISDLCQLAKPRAPAETQQVSQDVLLGISTGAPQTQIKKLHADSGVKDRFFQYFLDKLAKFRKSHPHRHVEDLTREFLKDVPVIPFSPVWRIKGIICSCSHDTSLTITSTILLRLEPSLPHTCGDPTCDSPWCGQVLLA